MRWFTNQSMTDAALDNPFLLFEKDRFSGDPIGLWTIDRGIFPDSGVTKRFPLPAECGIDPNEPDDPRRLRAAGVQILEDAALSSGHTLLDVGRAHAAAQALPATRPVPFDEMAIELCKEDFQEEIAVIDVPGIGGLGVQLDRYRAYGELIRNTVVERLKNPPPQSNVDWRRGIEGVFGKPPEADVEEARAQAEKGRALDTVAGSRIAVVIGPAGTGKTTVLRQLLEQTKLVGSGVALLAPTGKARVRLGQQTKMPEKAKTLAQFLREYGRYDWPTSRYFADSKKPQADGVTTCIVDEASMLTEDQFAALVDALPISARLLLVGDPRQLPPIGAGRPFVDLIAYLEREHGSTGVAELTVRRRQASTQGSKSKLRDLACADVQLADLFSGRNLPPGEDQILESVLAGATDDRLKAIIWSGPTQLREKLDNVLAEELNLANGDEENCLSVSLGGKPSDGHVYFSPGPQIARSEDWQVLTPHRTLPSGSIDLNRHVKARFRQKTLDFARSSNEGPSYYVKYRTIAPRGPEQITYGDKIICIRNHPHEGWRYAQGETKGEKDEEGYVANGEIGVVIGDAFKAAAKPSWTKVQFASQIDHVYSFGGWEFSEERSPILELAYAVTVHKAQGSEFRKVFLVLPDRSRLLSREMLYTALTRQTERMILMQQGGLEHLRAYRSAFFSEVARRITNLFAAPTMVEVSAPAGVSPGQVGRTFLEDKLIHRSARGDLVSSKSEVIIADALFEAEKEFGVRYFFERALIAPNGSKRWPDFSIEDPNGQVWFWENCGLLEQPDYVERWRKKLAWYAKHGIRRWSGAEPTGRLIVTEDGPSKGLDSLAIRDLIRRLWG
jgi:ATP-dependent exoDNAse (exonuclease V) alpha subunit